MSLTTVAHKYAFGDLFGKAQVPKKVIIIKGAKHDRPEGGDP